MNRVLKILREFVVTDLLGNSITFDNVYDAANYLNVSITSIYEHANNNKQIKANNMLYKITYKKYCI